MVDYSIMIRIVIVILTGSLCYTDDITLVGAQENVEVTIISGKVSGIRRKLDYSTGEGMLTDTVDEWLGVPYGKADRWQVSSYPDPWDGVRDCSRLGPVCPQVTYYSQTETEFQDEDCLVLNIYSPLENKLKDQLYPVMVFIHGGSYEEGSGNRYDGKVLATQGVVVVTVNYRLGELGYMTTGDDMIPGNYGLHDQILAVKWISLNIERFRGNSSCITLFGNSAGASSVGILMTTPQTEGLFHRAIIQSGSPLSYWATHSPDVDLKQVVRDVASSVRCGNKDLNTEVQCLRHVEYEKLIDMHFEVEGSSPSRLEYKPFVDGTVLPRFPDDSFRTGRYQHMDVMIGVVSNEWARNAGWFYIELEDHEIDKYLEDGLDRESFIKAIHHVVEKRFGWPPYIADVAMQLYTNKYHVNDVYENRQGYVKFMSDLSMFSPSIKLASILSSHQSSVYFYEFDHHSEHTDPQWWGSYHALELDFVFGSPFSEYSIAVDDFRPHGEEDRKLSKKMMKLWTDFAKYGNPTQDGDVQIDVETNKQSMNQDHNTEDLQKNASKWEPYENNNQYYLYISSNDLILKQHFRETETFLWNDLVPRLLESPWQPHNHGDHLYRGVVVWVVVGLLIITIILLCLVLVKYLTLQKKLTTLKHHYHPTTAV